MNTIRAATMSAIVLALGVAYYAETRKAKPRPTTATQHVAKPPAPESPKPEPRTYTVRKPSRKYGHDALWKISRRFYGKGDLYPEIAKANQIKAPYLIFPGQKLIIPELPAIEAKKTSPAKPAPKITKARPREPRFPKAALELPTEDPGPYHFWAYVTGYCPCRECTDDGDGMTAIGRNAVKYMGVAADLARIEAKTMLHIAGFGQLMVDDTGRDMRRAPFIWLDVRRPTHAEAARVNGSWRKVSFVQ